MNYNSWDKEEEKRLELEDHNGLKLSSVEDHHKLYKNWAREFERAKPGTKKRPRHFVHFILSADTVNDNADRVTEAARTFLSDYYGDEGYEYNFITHTDRKNPHVHVVMKLRNSITGRKSEMFFFLNSAPRLSDLKFKKI